LTDANPVRAVNSDADPGGSRLVAEALLGDAERIAERTAVRMRELLPSYARVPLPELTPVTLANARNLLATVLESGAASHRATDVYPVSGESRARQGISSDELLHGSRIGLEVLREEALAVVEARGIGKRALLDFVDALLRTSDAAMRVSASAHHEAEIRELGRLVREQAALRRVATMVARGSTAEEVFVKVAEEVASLLGAEAVGIQRYDPDGVATVVGNWGRMEAAFPIGTRVELGGDSVTALVYRTERPQRLSDFSFASGRLAGGARNVGLRSAVGSPIFVAGRLWGAIVAATAGPEPLPADAEARLAQLVELVATAISNVQARADAERLGDEQAALRRVATLVARGRPSETIFQAVADEVHALFRADVSGVIRFEADGWATLMGEHAGAHRAGTRVELSPGYVVARVRDTGRAARFDVSESAAAGLSGVAQAAGVRSGLAGPIVVDGRLWGAVTAATTGAEPMPADGESRIGQFSELVATALSNAQERAEMERLGDEQAALRRIATMVARECPPEEMCAKVSEEVVLLLGAEAALIQRFEPDGDATVVGSWARPDNPFLVEQQRTGGFRLGTRSKLDGESVTALVHRTQRPARLEDYSRTSGTIATKVRSLGLRCVVGSPVVVNGHPWGVIVAATTRAEPLGAEAESRMAQFTDLLGTSIAEVQTRSDLAASRARIIAAADEERRRVVRDLHDGAQQRLVHTVLTLKLARRALEQDRTDADPLLGEALRHARSATEELRGLAYGILPSALTEGGLHAAIRALTSRMAIPVQAEVLVERVPDAVEASAYFIVAEALTNVAKHSEAGHATVKAFLDRGGLNVEVRDDGIGGARVDGTGLVGLRDRAVALDGTLRVETPLEGGTLIAACIPIATSHYSG
jgi:signal transduction histidine kinase